MAKYSISFNGLWDYSSVSWINDSVTFYNAAGDVVTETGQATQWEVTGTDTIDSGSFTGCTNLVSIDIPNSIVTIEESAFSNCTNLISINIPDSVTEIGALAFFGCYLLPSITIPNSVTTIWNATFGACLNLKYIRIPNSVTTIEREAIINCNSLESLIIPSSVTTLGQSAFAGNPLLKTVTLPDSLTSIAADVLYNCPELESVYIFPSASLESMKGKMTTDNSDIVPLMTTVNDKFPIKFNDTPLNNWPFLDNSVLLNDQEEIVNIPTEVTQWVVLNDVDDIYAGWFSFATSLVSIAIPDSIKRISDGAFEGCSSLTDVTLNQGLLEIGYQFDEGYHGTFTDTKLTELVLPIGSSPGYFPLVANDSTITTIDMRAVEYTLTMALYNPAENCPNLTSWILSNTESITFFNLYDLSPQINIYVPADELDSFKVRAIAEVPDLDGRIFPIVEEPDELPVEYLINKDGFKYVPVAHANATYVNELNAEGKNKTVTEILSEKQNSLVAGSNITISNNVISATIPVSLSKVTVMISDPEVEPGTPSNVTVLHSLGTQDVIVSVYNNLNQVILPDNISVGDENTVTIDLSSFAGFTEPYKVVVIG